MYKIFFTLAFICAPSLQLFAIDNPEAPDYVKLFNAKAAPYKKSIDNPKNVRKDYVAAYGKYQRFLDEELNSAYNQLKSKLPKTEQLELKKTQKKWLEFRDSEFDFIYVNWNRANFGTSADMSRGAYRCKIIESRVIQLLHYLINY